jgi:hypothetical protein
MHVAMFDPISSDLVVATDVNENRRAFLIIGFVSVISLKGSMNFESEKIDTKDLIRTIVHDSLFPVSK